MRSCVCSCFQATNVFPETTECGDGFAFVFRPQLFSATIVCHPVFAFCFQATSVFPMATHRIAHGPRRGPSDPSATCQLTKKRRKILAKIASEHGPVLHENLHFTWLMKRTMTAQRIAVVRVKPVPTVTAGQVKHENTNQRRSNTNVEKQPQGADPEIRKSAAAENSPVVMKTMRVRRRVKKVIHLTVRVRKNLSTNQNPKVDLKWTLTNAHLSRNTQVQASVPLGIRGSAHLII